MEIGPRPLTSRRSVLTLFFGVLIGFSLAIIFVSGPSQNGRSSSSGWTVPYYNGGHRGADLHDAHTGNDLAEAAGPELDIGTHGADDEAHALENSSLADQLFNDVRVLCWVMTNPGNHAKKARHVKRTWGRRCNKLVFMSTAEDEELNSVALPVGEGRNNLWDKTKEAFKYLYANHLHEADWFLKADDDTYVVVENLRYMLAAYPPEAPLYFGCKFKPFVKQGYMSGGAGYVLSRESLIRFVELGIPDAKKCRQNANGAEDVELGKCMANVGVLAGDSRDATGRGRFFPFVPEHHLIPDHTSKDFWYWKYIFYKTEEGLDCCSDNAISFHYVSPNQMYVLDYLIYHLRPFGIVAHSPPVPARLTIAEAMAKNSNATKPRRSKLTIASSSEASASSPGTRAIVEPS